MKGKRKMNPLYAKPLVIREKYQIRIYDYFPAKKFFIFEENKYKAMSGTFAGLGQLDNSNNCLWQFHVKLLDPISICTLEIKNVGSVHFNRLLGNPIENRPFPDKWEFFISVDYKVDKFYLYLPGGVIYPTNITH